MNLLKEAAYLYAYSKELIKINRKIKSLSRQAEKHAHRYHRAGSQEKQHKHKRRHSQTTAEMKPLMKKHNLVVTSLRHHYLGFRHALHKEHKL